MGSASQKFDRQLYTLKLLELSNQMQIKSVASDKKAGVASRKTCGSILVNIVEGQVELLREWLERLDGICREVWQVQGEATTPDFVREILLPEAMTLIGTREGKIKSLVTPPAPRTRLEDPHPAQHHLAMEIRKLKGEMANRYEIEVRKLGYRNAPTKALVQKTEEEADQVLQVEENPTLHFPSLTWQQIDIATPNAPKAWQSRGVECTKLADEEKQIVRATKRERLLADCHFDSIPTLKGATMLELRQGPDEHLRVRFETLATEGGIALCCAKDVLPLKFWLYKLFLYLYKTNSKHLFAPGQTGAIITNVYEASANFCFWLAKQALEAEFLAKNEESAPRSAALQNGQENSSTGVEQQHPASKSWQEIKIAFLSDERIEICCGATKRQNCNYGEFGFQDRRNGKPNLAWIMLRELAKEGGTRPRSPVGKIRAKDQKRIEEIRERLKSHFKIDTDPIPFNGSAYQTSFKISCKPSFDT